MYPYVICFIWYSHRGHLSNETFICLSYLFHKFSGWSSALLWWKKIKVLKKGISKCVCCGCHHKSGKKWHLNLAKEIKFSKLIRIWLHHVDMEMTNIASSQALFTTKFIQKYCATLNYVATFHEAFSLFVLWSSIHDLWVVLGRLKYFAIPFN